MPQRHRTMRLAHYAHRLAAAVESGKKTALDELCFDLEYEQLERAQWPEEVFNFFLEALRDPVVCRLNGSSSFVLTLYSDFDKLTSAQRNTLLNEFDNNADHFDDEMLRHAVSDLIARLYPIPVALKIFNSWVQTKTPRRLHMAQVGFEVILMAKALEPAENTRVRSQLQKLRWLSESGARHRHGIDDD